MDFIEIIGKVSDSIGKFLDDLVAAWRKGDRRRVFLVGFVVLFLFAFAQEGWFTDIPLLNKIPQLEFFTKEQRWLNILWILVSLLFVGVIYESIKPPPPEPLSPTEFKESTAIKGLRSFTEKDREIFKQLQRNQVLQECLAEINRDKFRFGILFGESGCGKTSFIQAGLIPQLSQADSKVQGIYVRFSDRDPLVTLRQAFVEKLPLLPEDLNHLNFLSLLSQGVEAADKPLVLVFDQFEQFFVHFKRKEDRQFFIRDLANWYQNTKLSVKILVSIRKDFYAYLLEIQKAFGNSYVLSPQEAIELEKFSPEETTNVIEVIANTTEGLSIDRAFTQEIASQELASGEDGLISPVDLQLLAWIINGQKTTELRAFNEKAFQKLGGVEGLLTKFLERSLQTLITDNQRQATMKVLRSLTDAERRVRSGTLTFEEIRQKIPDISCQNLQEALNWLQADGVRLITPVEQSGTIGYELAHEKMIPALLKLVDKELPEADKANQLLERRVNEWLSNNRDSYYLLRWRELQLIQKQQPYLKWVINRQHKEKLIYASKRRFQRLFVKIIGLIVVMGFLWLGTAHYLATPQGEIQQVRWELNRLSRLVGNDKTAGKIAIAIGKDGNLQSAQEIIDKQIDIAYYKADALIAIAKAYDESQEIQKATSTLEKAYIYAEQIKDLKDLFSRSKFLIEIAKAYGKLQQFQEGISILQEVVPNIKRISPLNLKVSAQIEIAKAYSKLKQPEKGITMLELVFSNINDIEDLHNKSLLLSHIAKAYGETNQLQSEITMLKLALRNADQIPSSYDKAETLKEITKVCGQLTQPKEAIKLLETITESAKQIKTAKQINSFYHRSKIFYHRSKVLIEIANTYDKLNQYQKSINVLTGVLRTTNQIYFQYYRSRILIMLSNSISQFNQYQEGITLLKKALDSANQIEFSYYRSKVLTAIAKAYYLLNQEQKATNLLNSALTSIDKINNSSFKSDALSVISEVYAEFKNWGEARKISNKITIQDKKARSLAQILTIWVNQTKFNSKAEL